MWITFGGATLAMCVMLSTMTHLAVGKPGVDKHRFEHRSVDDQELITLPFYGGGRGQVLQIKRNPDGSVISEIVKQASGPTVTDVRKEMSTFQQNLLEIQRAASQLVTLQQNIKLSGRLTDVDRRLYAENLEKLGVSAQNLAHIQQSGGQDDFRLLFEGPLFGNGRRDEDGDQDETAVDGEDDLGQEVVVEEGVGEETSDPSTTAKPSKPGLGSGGDSVQVSVPDKDAAVAEAKPVGLAIAGEGGVASSKPIATAVVGPGGLAVARPVATAIAGVSASEVSALGIPLSTKFKSFVQATPYSEVFVAGGKKYGLAQGSGQGRDRLGVLVGPEYQTQAASDNDDKLNIPSEDTAQVEAASVGELENNDRSGEDDLTRRLTAQENELAAAIQPLRVGQPNGAISFDQFQQVPGYPFVSHGSPFRYNWNPEQYVEQAPRYEPLQFYDQRTAAFAVPQQFYPFHQQQNVQLPYNQFNQYQFRGHY